MTTPPAVPPVPPVPTGPPVAPAPLVISQRIPDLLAQRDSSLPLAAAALARVADGQGRTTFGELAIAYREEFLKLRIHARSANLPELGGLSVEEFRTSLRTSVLPRLVVAQVVRYPNGLLADDALVAFTREAWEELQVVPGAADQLLDAAERALARAESPSGAYPRVAGGSLLEATGLAKSYKGRRVVNDVSVRLEQGEIVGLLGPNGAGKTTTFYMITGLIRPDRGRIAFDGRDVTAEPMYQRARAGIGYLAQEPSVFRKLTVEDNVRAILETLPLDDAVGGQRHRGIGVLITDHNVEQTLDIVDRAYIMFEGKVQVSGTVRELVFDDRVANLYLGPTLTARLRARLTVPV